MRRKSRFRISRRPWISCPFPLQEARYRRHGELSAGSGRRSVSVVVPQRSFASSSDGRCQRTSRQRLCFVLLIEAKPKTLIGDRAYDSNPLDDDLRKDGIEMVAPRRSNRRRGATQNGRRLRHCARCWLVERLFAWIQWQRRILVRWEFEHLAFCESAIFGVNRCDGSR